MRNCKFIIIAFIFFLAQQQVAADYVINKSSPIEYSQKIKNEGYINHNYGEYRGQAGYKYHDGMDFRILRRASAFGEKDNRVSLLVGA